MNWSLEVGVQYVRVKGVMGLVHATLWLLL